ncbi:MAG: signal peptidase I [Gemmatimonadota bacterium]|nr:signal peptidase I [Gemmatimonadota bacterium]
MAKRQKSLVREYTETLVFAVLLFVIIRTDVVQAFRIPSGSMEDTLLVGDFLLVNKFIYGPVIPGTDIKLPGIRDPKPGDVIVFPHPEDKYSPMDFIKRCVAVEGQVVEVRDKVVYVDSLRVEDPVYSKHTDTFIYSAKQGLRDNMRQKVVGKDKLFVMGDNRDESNDSRFWGFVDKNTVKGQAFIIYWSWEQQPGDPILDWSWSQPVKSFTSLVRVVGYNVIHTPWRVRWNRIARLIE